MGPGLQVGMIHRIEVIDPHRSLAHAAGLIERQIFESLYRRSDDRLVSEFFEDELAARDGAYRATLREGLRWSDGSELTAEDVRASLLRSGTLGPAATIGSKGRELIIEVDAPLATLREALSVAGAALVKEVTLDSGTRLLGSGPYRRDPEAEAGRLRLIRNEHHAGPQAATGQLDFTVFESENHLAEALAKGLIDFTVALSPKELPSGSFVRTTYLPTPSTALLWLNAERLADTRLRRAIGHALDRRRLLSLSYPGAAGLSAESCLPGAMGHCPDQLSHLDSVAKELFNEAGVRPQAPLRCIIIWGPRPYLPAPMASAREIQSQLARHGLAIELEQTRDPVEYGARMNSGDFDMALGGWYADDPSRHSFLRALYESSSVPDGDKTAGRCNFGRYRSPACDAALARLREDPMNQDIIDEIGEIVRGDSPTIALHHGAVTVALGRRIRGREFDSLGFPWFSSFTLRRS